MFTTRPKKISTYHTVVLSLVFIAAGIVLVLAVNYQMKQRSLVEARNKARIILDRNLATHTYFSHDLKPAVFSLTDRYRSKDYFDPTWMSSTFAVRKLNEYFSSFATQEYYYKECAVNARTPENEADAYERDFILALNRDPALVEKTSIRMINGKPFFEVLRRGEVLEQACLRCHSTPDKAPGGLVKAYGAERSFDRSIGEVISAISIRIPLNAAYAQADRFSFMLSGALLLTLVALYLLLLVINGRLIFGPLNRIREQVNRISSDERHLGEQIAMPQGRELQDLTMAFNTMSANLLKNREHLEEMVTQRTADLQKALVNVKQLSGMLPICSSCKKIRDDAGYWSQIEVYIRQHSDAEFSHGICPECAKRLYPDYYHEEK